MRRLSGTYDGGEEIILEYPDGRVECRAALRALLMKADASMPVGDELEAECRVLFGDTLDVREV